MIFERTAITVNNLSKIIFYASGFGWEDTQLTVLVLLYITMFENVQKLLTVNQDQICQLDINWRSFIFQVTLLQNKYILENQPLQNTTQNKQNQT